MSKPSFPKLGFVQSEKANDEIAADGTESQNPWLQARFHAEIRNIVTQSKVSPFPHSRKILRLFIPCEVVPNADCFDSMR